MSVAANVAECFAGIFTVHEFALLESELAPAMVRIFADCLAVAVDVGVCKRIVVFFGYVVSSESPKHASIIDSWLDMVMAALLQTITVGVLTETLILMGEIFERNPEKAKSGLNIGLKQERYANMPKSIKALVVNYVAQFHQIIPKIKAMMSEINSYVRELSSLEVFEGFELEMKESIEDINP
eukprot:TRINITY_DN9662_c0_g1_i7.p1 TRINITY_DN9662_c0_g1~~TRINITY_DN9662_c0_g1_i7.p1  ORF type:complete len:183 (+),score=17.44 TRINITY_DN9662_c0_g1_i7:665-1213(+)